MRPFDPSQSSDKGQQSKQADMMDYQILDLLMLAPSSVAGLYGGVARAEEPPRRPDVQVLIATLQQMEADGWVTAWLMDMGQQGKTRTPTATEVGDALHPYRAWLPDASLDALSVDTIGLWYEITAIGKEVWRQWVERQEVEQQSLWTVEVDTGSQTLVVYAATAEVARERLHWWLAEHSDTKAVHDSDRVETVARFTLKNGIVVAGGVRLECRYQQVRRKIAS